MRGQVLKTDSGNGQGLILGDDGVRYSFSQQEARDGNRLVPGHIVDFVPAGEEARDIYLLGAGHASAPSAAQPSYVHPANTYTPPMAQKSEGIFTYFLKAISVRYFKFTGRARRQEYWGYVLFYWLVMVMAFVVDVMLMASLVGMDSGADAFFVPIFTILWALYNIIPGISVTVRRLHDQDLSGWMYLLNFIPYIGWFIVMIFMFIDSRAEPNTHGPSPKYGIRSTADTFA
ncbi:MAG: DUF805 domain-containing protein [Alphaproteobacteria bacterium]|nr:hypothetical protein [Hyphomonas sp.]MBR9807722.1 DUF805 domain-containing protein [Alphaproteobacteria bacterium]|tara:strand:- start:471 stop:1163 length:693 start_codon:yes stop_codon:yes gene_type:complete